MTTDLTSQKSPSELATIVRRMGPYIRSCRLSRTRTLLSPPDLRVDLRFVHQRPLFTKMCDY